MKSKWRYIEDDGCPASFGLAADEYITRRICDSPRSHILRLYTYKGPSVIVGRHQDVGAEVNLSGCAELGIEVNRRLTGGGAIVMGENQLGVAIACLVKEEKKGRVPLLASKTIFSPFTRGIIAGLALMGLRAWFRPENDIYVGERKIAGLACCGLDEHPAVLYHASILADIDTDLMLKLLRKPGEKGGAVTTISNELGRRADISELRDYVRQGLGQVLQAEFVPEPFNREELRAIRKLEEEKYRDRDWVYHGREYPAQEPCTPQETAGGTAHPVQD